MLGEQCEREPHADLRREMMRRYLHAAMDDPRPCIPADEAIAMLKARLAEPRPEPAVWEVDDSTRALASKS